MNAAEFNIILEERLDAARKTLGAKAEEYASDKDRLHNFENAAKLQETDRAGALGGMMIKHTISVYDMINHGDTTNYSLAQWEEKIGDHLNYLILLMAVVVDDRAQMPVLASLDETKLSQPFFEGDVDLGGFLMTEGAFPDGMTALEALNKQRSSEGKPPFGRFSNTYYLLIGKYGARQYGPAAPKDNYPRNIGDNNAENL